MSVNRVARVVILLLLLSPALFAAEDFTGKWGGTFVISIDGGAPQDDTAHMVVTKQTATELIGTIGPNADRQMPIAKSKIETVKEAGKDVTKITFQVDTPGDAGTVQFSLTFVAGHLKGNAKAEKDGQKMTAVIDLERLK